MRYLLIALMILSLSNSKDLQIDQREYPIDKIKEQNSKIVKMVVSEISKTIPQQIDKYTTITDIRDENTTLVYTFEINTGSKSDEAVKKEDKNRMQKAVINGVCQSSKRFIDADINIAYEYKSASTKKLLFRFDITKDKCKELKND